MSNFIEEIIEKDLAEGRISGVVTRFPPEPNGYLHIGHAKSICLNYYGTALKYGGKCNLRFDDTNPVKEDDEFVRSIIADVEWLGWKGDVHYASDYFDTMYKCAVKLIEKGKAYVDDVTPEQMKDRVLHAEHHRQGNKWCIYPLYDFAHPIEDAVEHITHSICTLEFEDHRPFYDWVIRECEFDPAPHQYEFARLNIERTIMSKRYLKKLVDEGFVDGWDDPRMPTIAGLRRRGYTPSSLRDFCERIGVAKANSEVEAGQLESCIRDELNVTAERVMVVMQPLELIITNRGDDYSELVDFEINPNQPEKGMRKISFSNTLYIEQDDFAVVPPPKYKRMTVGAYIRLKGAYIVKCTGYEEEDGQVRRVFAEIVEGTHSGEDNSGIKAKGVIHWVDKKNCVDIDARVYDYLLLPYDGVHEDFSQRMNTASRVDYKAKGEMYLSNAKPLQSFQFMRQGYFCKDTKDGKYAFNRVVGLKDSYKPQKK